MYDDKNATSIDFYNKDSTSKVLFTITLYDDKYKEKKDSLRKYLFGAEENIPQNMHLSSKGLDFMKKQEGVVDHVYNDAKGGPSKYCTEHTNHNAINAKSECDNEKHKVTNAQGEKLLGKPTIGLGHLITSQTELDDYCSRQPIASVELWKLFEDNDKKKYEDPIRKYIKVKLKPCEFDALFSFIFNTGANGFKNTNVCKLINSEEYDSDKLEEAMLQWKNPSIVVDRREDEIELFNDCKYTFRDSNL